MLEKLLATAECSRWKESEKKEKEKYTSIMKRIVNFFHIFDRIISPNKLVNIYRNSIIMITVCYPFTTVHLWLRRTVPNPVMFTILHVENDWWIFSEQMSTVVFVFVFALFSFHHSRRNTFYFPNGDCICVQRLSKSNAEESEEKNIYMKIRKCGYDWLTVL